MGSFGRWKVAGAVTAVSAVAHLWKLGLRPLAHDEAIDAFFSWQARSGGVMRYDPVYHGPLRFYLEGFVLEHVGTGAFHARLVAAVAGIGATLLLAASTRMLGRVGAPLAALAFTISPTALTVTRTGREDSLVALLSLGLLVVVARLLTAPRPRHVVAGAVLLALSFGVKETTFLFGLNTALFLAGVGVVAAARPASRSRAAVRRLAALGSTPWVWALTAFALTFMVIYTSGFRYSAGLESGLFDGVRYWWGQHDVGRGGQPWFFYLAVYGAYEWLVLFLAAVGVVAAARRGSLVGAWFGVMAAGHVVLYSWAGEKFAWLALHPLLPVFLLAGLGAQALADRRWATRPRVALAAAGTVAALLTAVAAVRPAITHGADPRELLVTVQTSADVPPIVERLVRAQRAGTIDSIVVDQSGGGSWPWAWYLHGIDRVAFTTIDPAQLPTDFDAIVVLALEQPPVAPEGYRVERFRLREWWVPDYAGAGAGDLARWMVTREVWSPTASSDQYLLIREEGR